IHGTHGRKKSMKTRFLFFLLLFLPCVPCIPWSPLSAAEPWADPRLPVRDGLELWLDATRAGGKQPAAGPLDAWQDGSGNGRHVRQPEKAARPTVVPYAEAAVVRFDGEDDHLRGVKPSAGLKAFTVFVVG